MEKLLLSLMPKQSWLLCRSLRKAVYALTTIGTVISFNCAAEAETVLQKIEAQGILSIGIREDAVPFGFRDYQGHFSGVCVDFIAILKEKVREKLGKNIISIRLVESTLFNRFRLVEDRIVDLECGPNTIRENLQYQVTFSEEFFVTGTQFLVKTVQQSNVNLDSNLANVNLGVMRDTSTQKYLEETYPEANLVLFQGDTGRRRGVQALSQDRINAMVSDGILLIGEAIAQGIVLEENYTLIPNQPLTCDRYGLILPPADPEWEALVNSVIEEFQQEERQWFTEIEDYLNEVRKYCQAE